MWKIKYGFGSWSQAERLSVAMNNAGFDTVHEEGHSGQFEIFRDDELYMEIDPSNKESMVIDHLLEKLFSMEVPLSG